MSGLEVDSTCWRTGNPDVPGGISPPVAAGGFSGVALPPACIEGGQAGTVDETGRCW
jgi:hypothetical protein